MNTEQKTSQQDNGGFLQIIKHYLESNPLLKDKNKTSELEVRFGTNPRVSKPITKIDYLNVVKYLYSCGFQTENNEGLQMLRIQNQFTDPKTGVTKISNVRAEINGSDLIEEYCKTNSIQKVLDVPSTTFQKLKFTQKIPAFTKDNKPIQKFNMEDFNFRVSFQTEQDFHVHTPFARNIISKWEDSLKIFRCLNRVRFYHTDYPVFVDISIVKSSTKTKKVAIPTYTIQESNLFQNPEEYEIELEVDNQRVGTDILYKNPDYLLKTLKKCIRIIMSGLQKTKFPISYLEQNLILQEYMTTIHGEEHGITKIIPKHFIGPSSSTLQIENIIEDMENSNVPNIRENYTVTEKADGERYLMYINEKGKIYLIDTNMNVLFTGTFTKEKSIFNSIIDGEYIKTNKHGNPIQLFAAFDVYYVNNKSFMNYPFYIEHQDEDENKNKKPDISRMYILSEFISVLKPYSILDFDNKKEVVPKDKRHVEFRVKMKQFNVGNSNKSIFQGCSMILSDIKDEAYEYETDGLIFTPTNLFVGASNPDEKVDIKSKVSWSYSLKWKPAEFNTIDFLVSVKKDESGKDLIRNIYQDGSNNEGVQNILQYKTLILRCGYDERKHGYLNPCQDIYDDKAEYKGNLEDNDKYKPVPFYPSNPSDDEAHLCNIYLKENGSNTYMTTEEGEEFEENMIVEFKYVKQNERMWNWVPIRVRYDKTSELRNGMKNYGNAFHVANNNWYSIHNPITETMISTGENIPTNINEEVYYNRNNNLETNTKSLRDFHNLYIKSKLIQEISSPNDILIDYSVGKAGDLEKWRHSKLKFVFGIDVSKDNIYNRVDGACARYLNLRKKYKKMPNALFVNGDSMKNIKEGKCFETEKEKQVAACIFGNGPKNELLLGKGVYNQYGVGENGFNVSSCQFSIHYFFKKKQHLHEFLRNVSECTKLGGHFIATGYDGDKVFKLLKNKKNGEPYTIMKNGKKIFEITKRYDETSLPDDHLSLGYPIDVYQESINKTFQEYLVQFTFFKRVMENYGFTIISQEEATANNLPDGSALFETMYKNMEQEVKQNTYLKSNIRSALNMTPEEKQISFLNRYYIFKKVRNVDTKNIKAVMNFDDEEEEKEEEKEKEDNSIEYQTGSIDEYPGSPEGTPPAIQIQRAKEEAEKKKMPKKTNKKITLKEINS